MTDPKPSPVQHISSALGCSDAHALEMAKAWGLIDQDNVLHCGKCGDATDWHVSLHCVHCRLEAIRLAPERMRQERERRKAEAERRKAQQEQTRPVAGRSFRDGY